ncbi:hypothetical protein [Enterococcus sp. AZ012]|uniref:hypothetical protein n=1 Tax=Enterococcus sp. AZ012 TaxID=2774682 RepID=UPI003D2747E5
MSKSTHDHTYVPSGITWKSIREIWSHIHEIPAVLGDSSGTAKIIFDTTLPSVCHTFATN